MPGIRLVDGLACAFGDTLRRTTAEVLAALHGNAELAVAADGIRVAGFESAYIISIFIRTGLA